jgi:hypothetical protein
MAEKNELDACIPAKLHGRLRKFEGIGSFAN